MSILTVDLNYEKLNLRPCSIDVLVISTAFNPYEKYEETIFDLNKNSLLSNRIRKTLNIIEEGFRLLKNGGLLFVYGLPKFLPHFAISLDSLEDKVSIMVFKNWIAVDLDEKNRKNALPPAHMGILMYLKSRKGKNPSPFQLNTKTIRIPYKECKFCGKNTKDWGGKKHLLNPLGACLSDVWRDLPKENIKENKVPSFVLDRIYKLVEKKGLTFVHIIEDTEKEKKDRYISINSILPKTLFLEKTDLAPRLIDTDCVLAGNSIEYMAQISQKFPEGVFDLVFADPPYNLEKEYNSYKDGLSDSKYIQWSYSWLDLMSKVVRPGGALFVLNLPKYSVYYANFLNERMIFRNWIAWDAMSTPAGKIMPAHYSLLYYTKPGGPITFNYLSKLKTDLNILSPIDSDCYCLNAKCITKRKETGDNNKVDLNDIWWNIHRIKHKKDRDEHPCQLPIKLMERIIKLTTNPGDTIFDPFCGAGTTAIAAKMMQRHYITMDMDRKYVEIAQKHLKEMQLAINGDYYLLRQSKKRPKEQIIKRNVEIKYINLCEEKDKIVDLEEVANSNPLLFENISQFYKNFGNLKKIAHRRLEIKQSRTR